MGVNGSCACDRGGLQHRGYCIWNKQKVVTIRSCFFLRRYRWVHRRATMPFRAGKRVCQHSRQLSVQLPAWLQSRNARLCGWDPSPLFIIFPQNTQEPQSSVCFCCYTLALFCCTQVQCVLISQSVKVWGADFISSILVLFTCVSKLLNCKSFL